MKKFVSILLSALVGITSAGHASPSKSPNIVFILADDLGIMDVNAYAVRLGSRKEAELVYETPNLDRLVNQGVAFSQAYANQLCSPTRAAIMTGKIAARLGVTTATPRTPTYYNQGRPVPDGFSPHDAFSHQDAIRRTLAWGNAHAKTAISPELPTLPKVLSGYDSAFIGKWHLGGHGAEGMQPGDHGFTEIAYLDSGASSYFNWRPSWNQKKLPFPKMPQKESAAGKAGAPTGEDYLTDDLTVQAVTYLKERAKTPDQPFFLYFCHFAVHTPIQAKQDDVDHFSKKPQLGNGGHDNPTYAAMVKSLDESVGAILKALGETGLADDTLVVFTSDNGGVEYTDPAATDNAPFKGGKACLYEGGVRVPLVYFQPGRFDQSAWCDAVVDCTDFLPTFAALTGNPIPADVDGQSILPSLENPAAEQPERTLYWHYPFNVIVKHPDNGFPLTPHSAIRVGDMKLIWDWHGNLELYDIPADPFEEKDLSEEKPELTDKLFQQLKSWIKANVEPRYLPRLNPRYEPENEEREPFKNLWDTGG
ncbi:sulfatase [Haloferula rosea]|uniref:Sulfatase n=1 Tax=Haloferula rosea TaxID=490093 RepID=A0A934RFP8_9BACT|nr:sulfatase [Haloferula rosea]MBK1827676.1 sulfatase [Haloferula rosea]